MCLREKQMSRTVRMHIVAKIVCVCVCVCVCVHAHARARPCSCSVCPTLHGPNSSQPQLFTAPWTLAYQAPLSLEFSRLEYWNSLPFPTPGDLPDPRVKPWSLESPALAGRFLLLHHLGFLVYSYTILYLIIPLLKFLVASDFLFFFLIPLCMLYLLQLFHIKPNLWVKEHAYISCRF